MISGPVVLREVEVVVVLGFPQWALLLARLRHLPVELGDAVQQVTLIASFEVATSLVEYKALDRAGESAATPLGKIFRLLLLIKLVLVKALGVVCKLRLVVGDQVYLGRRNQMLT